MRPRSLAAIVISALAVAVPGSAQQAPVFASETDVVKVTVTVFDAERELVTDLSREEFEILEDGVPQELLLFAQSYDPGQDDTLALDLGMLMDTSESMLDELAFSQAAAVRFLNAVPRARDLLTVFFDQDIRVSRYDSEHQQGLIRRIHEASGGGNTALYDAITVYLSRVYGAGGRQVMVLFSDGEDSISSVSMGQALEMVRSSNVTIYPIAFGFGPGSRRRDFRARAFLQQLAEITGGEMFVPSGPQKLRGIYDSILAQLEAQYVMGFKSSNPNADGRLRKLEVRVKREAVECRHRKRYYAPQPPETADTGGE
jgi:Ca-activated chloride channel family protein